MNKRKRCCETVVGPRTQVYQCTRNAVVVEDGRHYCKQHAPSSVANRRAASSKRYDDQLDRITKNSADRELGARIRALYERNGRHFTMQDIGYRIEVCGHYTETGDIDAAVRKAWEALK